MKKETYLGDFDIGYELVELYATLTAGGEFISNPSPRIQIGILPTDWVFIYQTIMHEAFEYACFRTQARFSPDNDLSGDCGSFMFLMDHAKFSNVCGRTSQFMIGAVPAVHKVWLTYHANRRKK